MRGQSFAGHALADVSTTGGSGAFLLGVNPWWGFVVIGLAATSAMEMVGVQRPRGRDVATGIVLGGVLGLAALFLYLGTITSTTTGASITILFGSMFVIDRSTAVVAVGCGVVVLAAVVGLYRMWLLSSLSSDMASARRRMSRSGPWVSSWGRSVRWCTRPHEGSPTPPPLVGGAAGRGDRPEERRLSRALRVRPRRRSPPARGRSAYGRPTPGSGCELCPSARPGS
jgi:hypothetical protein